MKASEVLRFLRISRPTLTKNIQNGLIKGIRLPDRYYDYNEESVYALLNKNIHRKIVIYGRFSTKKQKKDLENQIEFIKNYCFQVDLSSLNLAKHIKLIDT